MLLIFAEHGVRSAKNKKKLSFRLKNLKDLIFGGGRKKKNIFLKNSPPFSFESDFCKKLRLVLTKFYVT